MTKDKLPTINIKGHEYVQVKDRVAFFNEEYPNGSITTEIFSYHYESGKVVVCAKVTPDCKVPERFFTAYSQANESQGLINKTAGLENAETSAVGRALGFMGIGVVDSVASGDEVHKAIGSDPIDSWSKPNGAHTTPRENEEHQDLLPGAPLSAMCLACGKKAYKNTGVKKNKDLWVGYMCESLDKTHTKWLTQDEIHQYAS